MESSRNNITFNTLDNSQQGQADQLLQLLTDVNYYDIPDMKQKRQLLEDLIHALPALMFVTANATTQAEAFSMSPLQYVFTGVDYYYQLMFYDLAVRADMVKEFDAQVTNTVCGYTAEEHEKVYNAYWYKYEELKQEAHFDVPAYSKVFNSYLPDVGLVQWSLPRAIIDDAMKYTPGSEYKQTEVDPTPAEEYIVNSNYMGKVDLTDPSKKIGKDYGLYVDHEGGELIAFCPGTFFSQQGAIIQRDIWCSFFTKRIALREQMVEEAKARFDNISNT